MLTAAEFAQLDQTKVTPIEDEEDEGYYYFTKEDGTQEKIFVMTDDTRLTFSSDVTVSGKRSYYSMTALNFSANSEILDDGKKIACAGRNPVLESGVHDGENWNRLYALRDDKNMFREGDPISYLQVMVATIGVDADKVNSFATNQAQVVDSIEESRLSISGVDEDEEATNLIMLQNMLFYQYHVIDVQQQVLDALLNMGA